ncbi:hypothetical protein AB6A40_009945 [Gnathostoma spinigerum]|uniref:Uncharacterized protein n=1 Tax=Gnathostoma spinigerum TaxID=75299 RepID=A0ABD6EV63_9BILA
MSFETAMRVNRDFRAAYYRLFKVEILSAFPSVDELLNCAGTSLAEDVVLKIRNTEKKEGITAAMDIFWRLVCYKPSVVEKMYVFAVNAKPALHAVVYREIPLTSMGYYLKFFHSRKEHPEVMFADHQVVLDPLTRCINIMALMKHLDRNLWSGHEKVAEKIGELIAVEGMSDRIKTEAQLDRATCLLLRTLPHMNDVQGCWYYEFCNACLKDSSNASIPYYIDKNYRIQLGL